MQESRGSGFWRGFGRALVVVLLVGGAAACSRGDAAPRGRLISIHQKDFSLTASATVVGAGLVTFRVTNAGPSTHEFIVARTNAPADALPLHKNDLTINEDSPQIREVGSIDATRLGATRELTLRLKPGHYVLFCNLYGHYRGGMYAALEVVG